MAAGIASRPERSQPIPGWADPACAHQRWVQIRDIRLHDPVRHTRCKQVQRGAAVWRSIPGLMRR